MTTAPDPEVVRKVARTAMDLAATRRDDLDAAIRRHGGLGEMPEDPQARGEYRNTYGALYSAAAADMKAVATVAASWPDEQPDGAAGRVEAWLDNRIHSTFYGPVAPEAICSYPIDGDGCSIVYVLTESDLRAVLAERNALAGKVAELESKWNAAARTAVVYMHNRAEGGAASAELHALFADRIAALDGQSGKAAD